MYIWEYDHQVIVCRGYTTGSNTPKEVMFDWWGDTKHNSSWSGGPADRFGDQYPRNPWVTPDVYPNANTDCE
ncbi:MAG TPA: hypothetical protein VN673_06010 [Clostridia bacterium]|nr:hypothetical protein [Clostridia bacterium]